MRARIAGACIATLLLAVPTAASARLSDEYEYTYDQLWRASVRLVAVDYRFPITERDPENGYVLFEYREQGRAYQGSIELVRTAHPNGERVRVVVAVTGMPSYVERMLLDRLRQKLRDEHGAPAPRPRPARPAPPADEGDRDEPEDPPQAARR